jgi:ADP-dependent NAD(P)H-hydrate dehydratase / NAD(P)H-hydrate epimerase
MMRSVTRAQMREIDRRAVEERGIPADVLMENAGRAIADVAAERISPACPVIAVCGTGSNGGDGFVAARLLAERGFEVEVLPIRDGYDASTPAGRAAKAAFEHEGIEFVTRFKKRAMACVIDAIFGTGLARPVIGREHALIREMNALPREWFPILAADIPSGLDADTGRPLGIAVQAAATVAMGWPKAGFEAHGARVYVGELIVADIGFPADLADAVLGPP